MAIYRTVSLSFWTDPKIIDDFTPEDKYFYLYLFTNPHTNLAGCYEISVKQIAYETGYTKETVKKLINKFVSIHKIIDYSNESKEILLLNWHKYNWTSSEKFRKPLLKEIKNIKEKKFKDYLQKIFDGEDEIYPIDTMCIGTSVTVTDTVTDTVNNYSINFENIYKEYPRKGDKKKSYACFLARLKEGYSEEELLTATRNYADYCKKEKREEKYIKMASTFFGVNTPFVDFLKGGDSDDGNNTKTEYSDEEIEEFKKLL